MFKVCGVSFDHSVNYGTCLQMFALQKAVEERCNRDRKYRLEWLNFRAMKDCPLHRKGLKKLEFDLISPPFFRFQNRKLHFSNWRDFRNLEGLNELYDAFVCGSDVIWSPKFNAGSGAYFLKFATKYAFSYAASFGTTELSDEYLNSLQDRLSNLRQISLREQSGVDLVEHYTDYKAVRVVDPVLLFDRDEWSKMLSLPDYKEGDYIFVYAAYRNQLLDQFVESLQKKTGLRVIRGIYGPRQSFDYRLYPPSPEKWLQQLRDARYVVTNSYHGTLFAAIFQKNFYTVLEDTGQGNISFRMREFLSGVGLEDRIFNSVPENLDPGIGTHFDEAAVKIDEYKNAALNYLKTNLDLAYEKKHI